MDVTSSQTPDGRTVVQIKDDGGEPFSFTTSLIDVRGQSEFNEFVTIPLTRDKTPSGGGRARPSMTRGQILITGQSAFTLSTFEYVLVDVVVKGWVGAQSTVIGRGQLGGENPVMRVTFGEEDTFERITISARELVDGAPSSNTADVQSLTFSAVAYMWSD